MAFGIMNHSIFTLTMTTQSIMKFIISYSALRHSSYSMSRMVLGVMALSITTLRIATLSIMSSENKTEHNMA